MNSISSGSFSLLYPSLCKFRTHLQTKHQPNFHPLYSSGANLSSSISLKSRPTLLRATDSNVDAPVSGNVSFVPIEEIIEKDWSVLYSAEPPSIDRIITAGKVEESSRVLVSTGSEDFVDSLMDSSPSMSLFVVHDSLLILACIKEKYDRVKCWQGETTLVPDKWAPFDVVFLYFLPALPFKLDDILGSLAKKCSPGGRVIISHPQGREALEQQRQEYPEVVVSDLPDKTFLQSVAAAHSFDVAEFVDEPGLYLAVLICSRA
ncbi:S-adenosyl-L-methionine-dependent methyltransferase [Sesbania bispinosa]|nr:S-adenosyl-L-methionine-dependent methyltransferase [Sesbania bispinosa]